MTRILSFKTGGKWDYCVSYEETFKKEKLETDDNPEPSLLQAVNSVTAAALRYFSIGGVLATFKEVTFSYPETGIDTFVLQLNVKSTENPHVAQILKSEKISRMHLEEEELGPSPWVKKRNELNAALDILQDELVKYVHERQRAEPEPEFDFDAPDEGE
jgi:hypothetical protein